MRMNRTSCVSCSNFIRKSHNLFSVSCDDSVKIRCFPPQILHHFISLSPQTIYRRIVGEGTLLCVTLPGKILITATKQWNMILTKKKLESGLIGSRLKMMILCSYMWAQEGEMDVGIVFCDTFVEMSSEVLAEHTQTVVNSISEQIIDNAVGMRLKCAPTSHAEAAGGGSNWVDLLALLLLQNQFERAKRKKCDPWLQIKANNDNLKATSAGLWLKPEHSDVALCLLSFARRICSFKTLYFQ